MEIRFWGTRGSIGKGGSSTLRYGGHTSCVEARSASGTLVVLDCGTGAHGLGRELIASSRPPERGHILITHTHWDHIQGFPFFAPLRVSASEWDVYGPHGAGESMRDTLAGQMQHTYFPLALDELDATVRYHDLVEGEFEIGDIRVTARYLNHPALTLGYRLEADGVTVVYATDHEPHSRRLAMAEQVEREFVPDEDARHAEFLADADLVIHDAQYTVAEYPSKAGWGHSTVEYVVDTAVAADVRRLALFHHDPLRDDDAVDGLVSLARDRLASAGASLDVFAAAEGRTITPERSRAMRRPKRDRRTGDALKRPLGATSAHGVLIAVDDPELSGVLIEAARAEQLEPHVANSGDAGAIAGSAQPSLALIGRDLADPDPIALCRAVRDQGRDNGKHVGVVIVSNREDSDAERREREAGADDWLLAPFSVVYARVRMRAWLLRTACRWKRAPVPADESRRIRSLHDLRLLDTEPEERFDRYTRIAAALFGVPLALVTLVDTDRQWFKSCQGEFAATETPREIAFCAHTILKPDVLQVPDTHADDRFAHNPVVTDEPHVRFYAGVPLTVSDGSRVGTLCLVDYRARRLNSAELGLLTDLGRLVERELEAESMHRGSASA